jgi:hypothetical protein
VTRRRQGYAGHAESPLERRLRLRAPWTAFAVVIEFQKMDIGHSVLDIGYSIIFIFCVFIHSK